jgi:hypothetical protein
VMRHTCVRARVRVRACLHMVCRVELCGVCVVCVWCVCVCVVSRVTFPACSLTLHASPHNTHTHLTTHTAQPRVEEHQRRHQHV